MGYSPWSFQELDTTEQIFTFVCVWGFPGGASGREHASQCRRLKRRVQSLDGEDTLEKEIATPSSILFFFFSQYSYLESFMDRGAWWAIVHRVIKSQT